MDDPIAQFRDWVQALPPFTKIYLGLAVLLSLLSTMQVVTYMQYYFAVELVFEVWRLFTSFLFFRNLSFGLLLSLYFSYYFLRRVQQDFFGKSRRADFAMFVLFVWVLTLLLASLFGVTFLSQSLTTTLMVIWCYHRKSETMTLFFGLSMENGYFPYVFVGFSVLFGQPLIVLVLGIIIAIFYILIKDTIKSYYGWDLLKAPQFLKDKLDTSAPPTDKYQPRTGVRIGDPI